MDENLPAAAQMGLNLIRHKFKRFTCFRKQMLFFWKLTKTLATKMKMATF